MFKTRLLSGILLVIIALATIITGGDVLFATILAISLIGMTEIYKIMEINNKLLGGVGYVAALAYFALVRFGMTEWITMFTIAFLIVLMAVYVFTYPKYRAEHIMLAFFGLFYVAVMLSYVYQIRMLEQGAFLVWLVFLCSWGCDTCAYCVGVTMGKHKMAPVLSPKKSVEGGIGGVVGAALLGALYAVAINKFAGAGADALTYAVICGVGGIISQVGDLAASAIKRNHDIKDYGKLIPGHGGILDRFDSVIITAPIIFYMATILM
jgi:phosphatidate cytidylyltransferase